jgi:hypothetical protein
LDDRVDAVRDDMHFHIRTELESRDRLKTLAHDLKEDIKSVLMKRADGMYVVRLPYFGAGFSDGRPCTGFGGCSANWTDLTGAGRSVMSTRCWTRCQQR